MFEVAFEVFPEKYDVKITVLKRLFHKDLVKINIRITLLLGDRVKNLGKGSLG